MTPQLKNELILTDLENELLVYDPHTNRAHCLSDLGRRVFLALQSGLSHQEILADLVQFGCIDPTVSLEEMLNQFKDSELLLEQDIVQPAQAEVVTVSFDRRRFLEAAGAAAALPIIASVVAPRPAQAASCVICTTLNDLPTQCSQCGKQCDSGLGCVSTNLVCVFEFTLQNLTKTGNCVFTEFRGSYACRGFNNVSGPVFLQNCGQARDLAIDLFPTGSFAQYYCCQCDSNLC